MAFNFEELLGESTNADVDPLGFAGPQNSADAFLNAGGVGNREVAPGISFESLFSDPNFIRALGELGAIGGPGSVGQIAGAAGSQLARRKAVQAAGEQQLKKNKTLAQQIIDALKKDPTGSSLIGDKDDPNTLNGIKMTNDKVSFDMPNPGVTKASFQNEQQPLEAITNTGGQDLPDFLNSSLTQNP